MSNNRKDEINKEVVEIYEMICPLLQSVLIELKSFANKKPDGILNLPKVNMINKILNKSKDLLKNEPSTEFLDVLDDDILPSYSDAVIIIVQYNAALQLFKDKYTTTDMWQSWTWNVQGRKS